MEVFIRYLHFISIFGIVAALAAEFFLVKDRVNGQEVRWIFRIDGFYGVAAILAVAAGLILWFGIGKPADFYTKNWIFHLKVGLAILLAFLSLPPTIFYFRNRKAKADEIIPVPRYVRFLIRIELFLLVVIPLCAVLMAKGYGYFG